MCQDVRVASNWPLTGLGPWSMLTFSILPRDTAMVAPSPGLTFLLWSAGVMVSCAVEAAGCFAWALGGAALPEHAATARASAASSAPATGQPWPWPPARMLRQPASVP